MEMQQLSLQVMRAKQMLWITLQKVLLNLPSSVALDLLLLLTMPVIFIMVQVLYQGMHL